jgi:PKD repeat protein
MPASRHPLSSPTDRARARLVLSALAACLAAAALALSPGLVGAQSDQQPVACSEESFANAVAAGGAYEFDCTSGPQNSVLLTRELVVTKNVSFTVKAGTGRPPPSIVAPAPKRAFRVDGGTLTLEGLLVVGGDAGGPPAPACNPLTGIAGCDGVNGKGGEPGGDWDTGASGSDGMPGTPGGDGLPGEPTKGGCMFVGTAGAVVLREVTVSNCFAYGGAGQPGGHGGLGGNGGQARDGKDGATCAPESCPEGGATPSEGGPGGSGGAGAGGGNGGNGGAGGDALGGAIYNAGTLTVVNAKFTKNLASGGRGGGGGTGGFAGAAGGGGRGGRNSCGFTGACPGDGGDGGGPGGCTGSGGHGGNGGSGGDAKGGAIYNAGHLTVTGTSFSENAARGASTTDRRSGYRSYPERGQGGAAGFGCFGGGGGAGTGGSGVWDGSAYSGHKDGKGAPGGSSTAGGNGGNGGDGGDGLGGAVFNGGLMDPPANVTNSGNAVEAGIAFDQCDPPRPCIAGPGGDGPPGGAGGQHGTYGPPETEGGYGTPTYASAGADGRDGSAGSEGTDGVAAGPDIRTVVAAPPTAEFKYAPEQRTLYKVDFDASGSEAGEGARLVGYSWAFGNGKASTGVKPSHTYEKPGKYQVKLTVRDNYGQEASVTKTVEVRPKLEVTLKATPAKVEVKQTEKGPEPVEIALRVTVTNPNPVNVDNVTLPEKVDISLPDELEATKKALKQKSAPSKKVGKKTVPDLGLGTLKKKQSASRTYILVLKGDGAYEVSALVTASSAGFGRIAGLGETDVEGSTPLLFMTAKLGARVRSQQDRRFIKAGTNYLVKVVLHNRSYTKKIVVHPIYADLERNASDGHLQTPGRPIDYKPRGTLNEVHPSQYLVFAPRTKREFDVLVRTSASDSWITADEGGNGGGSRSIVKFDKPKVSIVKKGGREIERVSPKKVLVKLKSDDPDRIVVPVDDSAPPRPEFSSYVATLYIAKGVVVGLWNVTWGSVRGVLWDLPLWAVKSLLAVPPAALSYMNHQVELWGEVEGDRVLRAQFVNALLERVAVAFEEAPYMNQDKVVSDIYHAIDRAVAQKYTNISRNWYDGDWKGAAEAMGTEVTERAVDVATALAPAVLARMPRVAAKWEATRTALYAKAFEALHGTIREITGFRAAVNSLRGIVMPGLVFTNRHMAKLFGLATHEAEWARAFVKNYRTTLGRKISMVFRSRLEESIRWLENGAYLKPYWMKLKNVNRVDTQYLGYFDGPPAPGDVGRLIIRRPPPWEDVVDKLRANNVKTGSAEFEGVRIRWQQRHNEYHKGEVQKMFEHNRKGEVEGKWPWQENGVDPTVQVDEVLPAGFRLKRTRPGEFAIEVRPKLANGEWGEWGSVTGDIDLVALTAADGTSLTDAEHVALLKALRDGPFGAQHPESATWIRDNEFWFRAKENYLKNDGECCLAQVGFDGNIRAVQFNEKYSFFPKTIAALKAKHLYRIWWNGGIQAPPSRAFAGVFGGG